MDPIINDKVPNTVYTELSSDNKGVKIEVFIFIKTAKRANNGTKLKYVATGNIAGDTISAMQK